MATAKTKLTGFQRLLAAQATLGPLRYGESGLSPKGSSGGP